MPVLWRIACCGISCVTPLSFWVTLLSCSIAPPASASGAAGFAGAWVGSFIPGLIEGFAAVPPSVGLRITGLSFSVEARGRAIGLAGGGSVPATGVMFSSAMSDLHL